MLQFEEMRQITDLDATQGYAQALLESAPDSMIIVGADGRIRLVNAQTEKLFGYSRQELDGARVEELIPRRYRVAHVRDRSAFSASPRRRPMGEGLDLWAVRKDGSEFPVEISLSPLQTEKGTVVTAAIRDVTERKQAELALRQANAQLEAASQAKDNFLASMSHELRTPLNAIIGFTGTLLMGLAGELNDEQRKQLTIVQVNGRHLLAIINDLLDLAKIEAGTVELDWREVDCAALLEEVAASLRPLADEKGLTIELSPVPRGFRLVTDRRALKQILLNLANNAVKFTESGSVRLEAADAYENGTKHSRLTVADTGIGIRPEEHEKLFKAFAQLEGGASRRTEGTGLGLYICSKLAALLGARIRWESEAGRGSTFMIEL